MSLRQLLHVLLASVCTLAACTGAPDDAAAPDGPGEDAEAPADAAPPEPRRCLVDDLGDDGAVVLDGAAAASSLELARRTHRCAEVVVLVPANDVWAALIAAPLAVRDEAPLLLVPTGEDADVGPVQALLDELAPTEVVTLASATGAAPLDELQLPPDAAHTDRSGDRPTELAQAVVADLGPDRIVAAPVDDPAHGAAALTQLDDATALLPLPEGEAALADLAAELPSDVGIQVAAEDEDAAAALVGPLVDLGVDAAPLDTDDPDRPADTVWLADPEQPAAFALAAVAAAQRDERALPVTADDLRAGTRRTERIVAAGPGRAVLVGEVTDDAEWQLDLLLHGTPLPTGGFRLFEDTRMVALYGTPGSSALGVLGEQDLDATVERAREVAAPYDADGRQVVPTFEMIVTVASAGAEPTGDYSRRIPAETFRPWIDRAAEEGFHVVLDLQPGRTDFLTQAREYEELLREPHVGLALDPEWRLEDDEVHLRQIGSVDADEVQTVVDWLAELTREHRLPQKLLVLHQFRHSMLPDRDRVEPRPELAIVVHMDGQGPIGTKYETYDAVTAGAEDRWWWGWKNFYDEDQPTPSPEQVLELDPVPVFVSYQ